MAPGVRPRSSVIGAWIDGWRGVIRAPGLTVGLAVVLALTNGVTWPQVWPNAWLSWVFSNDATAFGGSLDLAWHLGHRPALHDLAFARVTELGTVNGVVVLLMFLSGGIIDRLARDRRVGTAAFFGASGVAFPRFLRLSAILGAVTWLFVHLVLPAVVGATPEVTPDGGWWQPRAVAVVIGVLILFGFALLGDYARVRIVVEDRHSAIGAIGAAGRFMWRRPLQVLLLYSATMALEAAVMWLMVALLSTTAGFGPGPDWIQPVVVTTMFLVFGLVGAIFKLGFVSTTVAYFQSQLAHAGYTAAPVPTWPDSPAVEAIANLEARSRAGASDPNLPL
jgi:hypothetical protein